MKNIHRAVYIDDCILAAREKQELKKSNKKIAKEFQIMDEREVDVYLGVKIEVQNDSTIKCINCIF